MVVHSGHRFCSRAYVGTETRRQADTKIPTRNRLENTAPAEHFLQAIVGGKIGVFLKIELICIMEPDLQELKKMIDAISPLPDEEWLKFASLWKPVSAGRKQLLTATGDKEYYLYFVLAGVQRVLYQDEQNREATLVFTYAPSFGGVLDAMLTQQNSRYSYQTLSPSRFLRAQYKEIALLSRSYMGISQMIQRSINAALCGLLERMTEMQCFSSEEKFRSLLKRSPHILQHVPHKYLANYLGIDPTNFSKLINRVVI